MKQKENSVLAGTCWIKWKYRLALGISMAVTGAVACAQQTTPLRLTLKQVAELAVKQNLSVRVASAQLEQSAGTNERRKSLLLPHVNGDALATRENIDLAALGISFPGVPMVVGPFSYYDFRVSATQAVIDRRAYHDWKASQEEQQAAKLDYQDARDLVIRQAATLYLTAQASEAVAEAAASRVTTSEILAKLARDQHLHGLATAVDEVRAQVQLARDQQSLLVARNAYQTSLLSLARFLGVSPGTPLELAEPLRFQHVEAVDPVQVLPTALEARADYAALLKQRDALAEEFKASHARYLPALSVNGNYGAIGPGFGSIARTGEVQGVLSISLFDRDRAGERTELEGRVKQLNAQIDDLHRQIEQEIRAALLDLSSTESQVTVTESALRLAERELELAQDRFRNGVTDNIEVITAQTSLASAQDDRISALARHADVVMALVRALGGSAQAYQAYFGEP